MTAINDDSVAQLRRRIGFTATSQLTGKYPFNLVSTTDGFRHFANGYGDDNPLWCDPLYAASGSYGRCIAPPTFIATMGQPVGPPPPDDVRRDSAGALAGVQAFQGGGKWEFHRPLTEGHRVLTANVVSEVEDKTSSFGGGRSVIVHHRQVWWLDDPDIPAADAALATYRTWYINTDRSSSRRSGGENQRAEAHSWSKEEIAAIDAEYATQQTRGGLPRAAGDVAVGDTIDTLVKGPLTVTDLISFHIGWGWSGQGTFSSRLSWKHRRARPHLWPRDPNGVPDTSQRGHWDASFAGKVGTARAYDYGFLRTCWFAHTVTSWMGDDAWLWKLEDRIDSFNYVGDATWVRGSVAEVGESEPGSVGITLTASNQDDLVTASGGATVLLPGADGQPPKRPAPPADVVDVIEQCRT
ncbi:MAG: MaoC family dehydratase N-terminal domain-containing protein [Ilumatobacteraceae bacterium]|nr:MaoC family dehydratase N-terminal domain-containing protein [Ilumatobacteraceae bacterium]